MLRRRQLRYSASRNLEPYAAIFAILQRPTDDVLHVLVSSDHVVCRVDVFRRRQSDFCDRAALEATSSGRCWFDA